MNAGRELDALIAEKVMGWENNWNNPGGSDFPHMWGIMDWYNGDPRTPARAANFPAYSHYISAAWEVVQKMRVDGWNFQIQQSAVKHGGPVQCYFHGYSGSQIGDVFAGHADTAPHAICLAALKAVGVEVPS